MISNGLVEAVVAILPAALSVASAFFMVIVAYGITFGRAKALDSVTKRYKDRVDKVIKQQVEDAEDRKPEKTTARLWERLHERFLETESRLEESIERVRAGSRSHLLLGIIFAILGFLYIAYYPLLMRGQTDLSDIPAASTDNTRPGSGGADAVAANVPDIVRRLPGGVLVQIFSLFFLRLYRTSFDTVRYYQNELTNIQALQSAAMLAMTIEDAALRHQALLRIVYVLSLTERNFVMRKNETAVPPRSLPGL